MVVKIPKIKFNNGQLFPMFGLGTWKSQPGEVTQAVKDAIDVGYRHIDCAHLYGNEKEVGEAIKCKITEGIVKREDLFITSKLWCNSMHPNYVEPALKVTLSNLGLSYLDLYLIHWPITFKPGPDLYPEGADGKVAFDTSTDYVDTWIAMEAVCKKGLTRSIGVSNFSKRQIEKVLERASIVPVTNQVECHPYLPQKKLIEYCRSKNITITAYSPLGSPDRPWAKPTDPKLTEDPKVVEIARKYGKSPAQVILRYQVQRGNITIPKSVNKQRIKENMEIFDFELDQKDIEYIDTFDCNGRVCHFVEALGHPTHPFENGDEF